MGFQLVYKQSQKGMRRQQEELEIREITMQNPKLHRSQQAAARSSLPPASLKVGSRL